MQFLLLCGSRSTRHDRHQRYSSLGIYEIYTICWVFRIVISPNSTIDNVMVLLTRFIQLIGTRVILVPKFCAQTLTPCVVRPWHAPRMQTKIQLCSRVDLWTQIAIRDFIPMP